MEQKFTFQFPTNRREELSCNYNLLLYRHSTKISIIYRRQYTIHSFAHNHKEYTEFQHRTVTPLWCPQWFYVLQELS